MLNTGVRETSLEAYSHLKESGALGYQCELIMEAIRLKAKYFPTGNTGHSLRELCSATKIEINAVSGRCNELKKLGLIEEAPKRKCSISGRTINPLRLPVPKEPVQEALFDD